MSLGPMELALLLGLALLLFGPSRLPGLGRSLGDAIRGFKKGMEGDDEKEKEQEQQPREQLPGTEAGSKSQQTQTEKDKNQV